MKQTATEFSRLSVIEERNHVFSLQTMTEKVEGHNTFVSPNPKSGGTRPLCPLRIYAYVCGVLWASMVLSNCACFPLLTVGSERRLCLLCIRLSASVAAKKH